MRITTPQTLTLLALITLAAPAPAQQSGRFGGSSEPGSVVEAGVADMDPLRASQRRIEPGIGRHSFEARLTVADFRRGWSPLNPATPIGTNPSTGLPQSQPFEYNAPGLRALLGRPDYIRGGNGKAVAIVPANTVFQLTLDKPAPRPAPAPPHANFVDFRQDFRPDPRLLGRTPDVSASFDTSEGSEGSGASGGYDTTNWRYPQAAVAPTPHLQLIDRTASEAKPTVSDRGSDTPAPPVPSEPLPQHDVVDQPNP